MPKVVDVTLEAGAASIHRVFRPDWDQSKPLPRLLNSAWMIVGWFLRTLGLGHFDAVIVPGCPPMPTEMFFEIGVVIVAALGLAVVIELAI